MIATMSAFRPRHLRRVTVIVVAASILVACGDSTTSDDLDPEERVDQAIDELVAMPGGPPGAIVVVQRGSDRSVHAAGVAEIGAEAEPDVEDHMRIASVSKAFSGATALSIVDEGELSLDDTIAERLPDLPAAWGEVTLRQISTTRAACRTSPRAKRSRTHCWPRSRRRLRRRTSGRTSPMSP
jgi:D-alanyl-D-alanine carboxypeptidase